MVDPDWYHFNCSKVNTPASPRFESWLGCLDMYKAKLQQSVLVTLYELLPHGDRSVNLKEDVVNGGLRKRTYLVVIQNEGSSARNNLK
jgi:hypothetical protein